MWDQPLVGTLSITVVQLLSRDDLWLNIGKFISTSDYEYSKYRLASDGRNKTFYIIHKCIIIIFHRLYGKRISQRLSKTDLYLFSCFPQFAGKKNPGNSLMEKIWSHMTFPLLTSSSSPPDSSLFHHRFRMRSFPGREGGKGTSGRYSVCKTPKSLKSMVSLGNCKHISEEYNARLEGQLSLLVWLSFPLLSTETRVRKYFSTPN